VVGVGVGVGVGRGWGWGWPGVVGLGGVRDRKGGWRRGMRERPRAGRAVSCGRCAR